MKAVIWSMKLIRIDNEAYMAKVLTAGIEENAPETFEFSIIPDSRFLVLVLSIRYVMSRYR